MTNRHDERGAGLFSTVAGLVVFLALLLFAVETMIGLYARSVVTDAAWNGVRVVAGARNGSGDLESLSAARSVAESRVRSSLGRFGERVVLDWSASDQDVIRLTVHAVPPGLVWKALRPIAPQVFARTVAVRVERWR